MTVGRQRKADVRVWKEGIKGGIERRGDGWEEDKGDGWEAKKG